MGGTQSKAASGSGTTPAKPPKEEVTTPQKPIHNGDPKTPDEKIQVNDNFSFRLIVFRNSSFYSLLSCGFFTFIFVIKVMFLRY